MMTYKFTAGIFLHVYVTGLQMRVFNVNVITTRWQGGKQRAVLYLKRILEESCNDGPEYYNKLYWSDWFDRLNAALFFFLMSVAGFKENITEKLRPT